MVFAGGTGPHYYQEIYASPPSFNENLFTQITTCRFYMMEEKHLKG